ncbi:MAG: sterol desaturase family protein [Pseudomonadota bacterium]
MKINQLLDSTYSTSFFAEYATVFVLQVSLYVAAAGMVAAFYKFWLAIGVGERIEQRPNYNGQVFGEIRWALGACAIIAGYVYLSSGFIEELYPSNRVVALVHIFGFVVVYDFYMYLTHKALHTDVLRKFHARHHTAISATPWSCLNMHPVEALINYLPFLIFAAFSSVSLSVFLGIHAYLLFGIAHGHSNYRLISSDRLPALLRELTDFHQKHHTDGRGNFGYLYTHWDWLLGTRHE